MSSDVFPNDGPDAAAKNTMKSTSFILLRIVMAKERKDKNESQRIVKSRKDHYLFIPFTNILDQNYMSR
jgi:hypothetical protein